MATEKIKLFAKVASGGKRSFQLLPKDITDKNLTLFGAINQPAIWDASTQTLIAADETGQFQFQFDTKIEYEVIHNVPQKEKQEQEEISKTEFMKVMTVEELKLSDGKKRIPVHDRDLVIFLVKGSYYALDGACYHFGGPLIEGDIEDISGHPCVKCPWHKYIIALDTGEGFYSTTNSTFASKGIKQRTHEIKVEGNDIYVRLSQNQEELASDHYANMGLWKLPQQKPNTKPNNIH